MHKPYSQQQSHSLWESKKTFCNCWGNLQLVDVSKSHKKFFWIPNPSQDKQNA